MNAELKRILVVDSEQHQLETICRGLLFHGYACHGVMDVAKARRSLRCCIEPAFDALIIDLTMSGAAGIDIVKMVRAHRPDLPIVALSGLAADRPTLEAVALGVHILQKPFEPKALDRAIRAA
jgi:DNA-binding response OmpR family regulator